MHQSKSQPVESKIYTIREQKVMIDSDLAELYGIETKALNQAVSRNSERFPSDFMFRLTQEEYDSLRSQFVTLDNDKKHKSLKSQFVTSNEPSLATIFGNSGRGGRRKLPYVFTEQGVAMLSGVIKSKQTKPSNSLKGGFANKKSKIVLKGKKLGCKFRCQRIIGRFITDLYYVKVGLVIEVDGAIHISQKVRDIKTNYHRQILPLGS